MRVLLVTRDNPYGALTGVATYVRDLASMLTFMGHDVAHLYCERQSLSMQPSLRWATRARVLSAILAIPSAFRSRLEDQLAADVASPRIEWHLKEVLERVRPDVVHIHDVSGFPVGLITTAKARQCRVVVTLHDFWPFCRQFLLIRPGLVPCAGSEGGHNCALYCSQSITGARRVFGHLRATLPAPASDALRQVLRLYRRMKKQNRSQFIMRVSPPIGARQDQQIARAYGRREKSMREAMLGADCLLTVSEFAKAMYVRHGYPGDRIRVLPLSLLSAEKVEWRQRSFQGYPVRFGYLGRVTPWKGAHLLAEAVRGVDPRLARFTFHGAVEDEDRDYLVSLSGGHPALHFAGRYGREDLPSILEDIDVAVFPSVMSETLGLVGMEIQAAGVPIIGSDHGAIPEGVRHDVNGLLFPVGNASALRSQILSILREPEVIARLSSGTRRLPQMDSHVRDVVRVYAEAWERSDRRVSDARVPMTSGTGSSGIGASDWHHGRESGGA